MNFKQKLAYMALGCLFTIIGYILASLGGDTDVQAQGDKSAPTVVDEIVCRKLKVVNGNGQPLVVINTDYIGGLISIKGADGTSSVLIGTLPKGGFMRVVGADGENAVKIATDSINGGYIYVNNADSLINPLFRNWREVRIDPAELCETFITKTVMPQCFD